MSEMSGEDLSPNAYTLLQLVVKFDLIDDFSETYSWKYIQICDDRLLINKLIRTSSENTTENVSPKAKEPEGKRALRLTYVRKVDIALWEMLTLGGAINGNPKES